MILIFSNGKSLALNHLKRFRVLRNAVSQYRLEARLFSEKRSQKNKKRKVQKFGVAIFLEKWIFHCVVTQECPTGSTIETNVETVATYLSERG